MASRAGGNAAKRVTNTEDPPWRWWTPSSRHARAIRWIQHYCVPPKGYGAGQPMQLAPFQKEWLEESLPDDVNSSAMSLPRGNGKSTFLAAVGIWAVFDQDETGAPQVPIVATTVSQAIRSVYGVALSMVAHHYELQSRSLIYSAIGNQRITTPYNGGEMFPASNDPDGLQGLDPSLAVCDELGFMPIESWDSLLLASGKRPRSLVVGIGTPGFDHENALWHLRTLVNSGATLPGFRFTEYAAPEGCDIHDEKLWRAANPAMASGYMGISALRTAVAISPEAHFRIFRLGQWVEGVECWLGSDGHKMWTALTDAYEFTPGAPTWVGVDVGLKRDSTAVVALQRRSDGRLHAKVRLWVPTRDEAVDVTDVMAHLRTLDQQYDLAAIAFDPRFFDVPAKMLEDEGLPVLEFPQSLERMTPAVGQTFETIKRGELSHDGDDPFAVQILNAVARMNERGFTLAKGKSRGRIDATVALCMAVSVASAPVTTHRSAYEDDDLLTV